MNHRTALSLVLVVLTACTASSTPLEATASAESNLGGDHPIA
jgi:hypothetical protein